ncbi:MAG: DUF5360 family protein [Myxococcota bacterium]
MTDDDFACTRLLFLVTDLGMLTYWSVTALHALGVLHLPPAWLYSDYADPVVTSWNWSFLPLDLLLSLSGLAAARLHARGHPGWRPLALASLGLTFCAGFMAVSFWAVRCEFDPVWWGLNLWLVAWPAAFAPRLWRTLARA